MVDFWEEQIELAKHINNYKKGYTCIVDLEDHGFSHLEALRIYTAYVDRQVKPHKKTSKYKGVYKRAGKWEARKNGVYLGRHETEEKAKEIYDKYRLRH